MYFSSRFTRDDLTNSFEYNTYDDWFLIPTSRPVIQPPKPKQNIVDVPGANGTIDLSRSLTGYPLFSNRQGTNEYMIENDKWPKWLDALTEITNKLDGQYLRMYFEDEEPEYYYVGTWSIASWESGEIYSTITIEYDLYPFKMRDFSSGSDDQLWDTFNFNKDYIVVTADNHWRLLRVDLDSQNTSGSLFRTSNELISGDLVGFFGEMPTHPVIDIHGSGSWRVQLAFQNTELGIDEEKVFEGTANRDGIDIPEFIMTMANPQIRLGPSGLPQQNLSLSARLLSGSSAQITVRFNIGRL